MIDVTKAAEIPGYMSHRELEWLATLASQSQVVVEVGTFQGRSTRALGDHCPGTVYTIDSWRETYEGEDGRPLTGWNPASVRAASRMHLADLVASGKVIEIEAASLDVALERIPKADLIFLDGDHRFVTLAQELDRYGAHTTRGGILAGHDFGHPDWPGVERAVRAAFPRVWLLETIWWTVPRI